MFTPTGPCSVASHGPILVQQGKLHVTPRRTESVMFVLPTAVSLGPRTEPGIEKEGCGCGKIPWPSVTDSGDQATLLTLPGHSPVVLPFPSLK